MKPIVDSFGRTIDNLRISVTDRCNFRCIYCMPEEGLEWYPHDEILTYEEIDKLVRIFAGLGIKKLRISGGEPLVRKDLSELVAKLSVIPHIQDIAISTNGYLLNKYARQLYDAGCKRLNVSLDSLIPERFNKINRHEAFHTVMKGLETAAEAGFNPIKINSVIIRGMNEEEVLPLAEFARKTGYILRFIEYMPIGADKEWENKKVVPTEEIVTAIGKKYPLHQVEMSNPNSPADRWVFNDGVGEIGFIPTVSKPFCDQCNRVRITADGMLRTCLFSIKETNIKELLRSGANNKKIADVLREAIYNKEEGHLINTSNFVKPSRTMSQIGG